MAETSKKPQRGYHNPRLYMTPREELFYRILDSIISIILEITTIFFTFLLIRDVIVSSYNEWSSAFKLKLIGKDCFLNILKMVVRNIYYALNNHHDVLFYY